MSQRLWSVECVVVGVLVCGSVNAQESSPWKVSGFVKADWSIASSAVGTFARNNQVASTEAAAQTAAADTLARQQWNVGQSRLGVDYLPVSWGKLRGEIDFVDFDQASATTTIRPRLRILQAVLSFSDTQRLELGQDWDILAPPKPFTYNYVGLFFRAGNVGFMRPQVRWTGDWGILETALSVGLPAINTSATDSSVERGLIPYTGLKFTLKPIADLQLHLTGVASARRLEDASGFGITAPVFGASFSGAWKPVATLELRTNAFVGRNLQSSGAALTLAQASLGVDQSEWGGFVSARFLFLEHHAVHATVGVDRLFNVENAALGALVENWALRAGYAFLLGTHLEAFGEWSHLKSGYLLSAGLNRFDVDAVELGIVLRI